MYDPNSLRDRLGACSTLKNDEFLHHHRLGGSEILPPQHSRLVSVFQGGRLNYILSTSVCHLVLMYIFCIVEHSTSRRFLLWNFWLSGEFFMLCYRRMAKCFYKSSQLQTSAGRTTAPKIPILRCLSWRGNLTDRCIQSSITRSKVE